MAPEEIPDPVASGMSASSTPAEAAAKQALADAEARFVANNPLSKDQHELATASLPGGNTRSLLHTQPFPLSMTRGENTFLWDKDGHKYLDLAGDMSAGLYSHSPPSAIRAAILSAIDDTGLSLGATSLGEQKLAALLCERFSLARVRMTNSGTEANLYALAAARRFTRKRKVVVFAGGYHGGAFSFPSPSVTGDMVVDREDFVVVPEYNDPVVAAEVIRRVAEEGTLAAVLVEALQGAGGVIPGDKEFLLALRKTTREAGAVFVLDEVMTSRLAPGGLASELGLEPDLVTLGKYLGGGFSFGAFGGREDVMSVYDPRREDVLAHSGTFNNNTMTMHAGYAGLSEVFTPTVNVEFNQKGDALRERLVAAAKGTKLFFTGKGSMIGVHCADEGLESAKNGSSLKERRDLLDLFWFEMLERGFWFARRGFMALMLGTPDEELDKFVEAVVVFLTCRSEIFAV